ncbi:MAG TPA: recombinase family protein [Streptosporangiaceae bacterium]
MTVAGRLAGLTTRQVEILELAAHGLSGRQIGRHLGISARTVEGHFSNMRQRTGACSEAELTAYGVAAGLLDLGSPSAEHNKVPERGAAHPPLDLNAGKRPSTDTPARPASPQVTYVRNPRPISMFHEQVCGTVGAGRQPAGVDGGGMAKIGYARVSACTQNDDSQVDELTAYGVDKLFIDKGVSGKHASRPELDAALAYLREGDVLVITRLSRAMRSLQHLLALADELGERGVGLVVLKQAIDTTTPQGRLVFHLLGAIDEFQRELIVEGTREGLAAARARGRTGGRKPKLTTSQIQHARQLYADGDYTVAGIATLLGVSRQTIYRALEAETIAG